MSTRTNPRRASGTARPSRGTVTVPDRSHRVEVYSPAGKWTWGQWVSTACGTGTLAERLRRAALDTLGSEPAGSSARVFRYGMHSAEPLGEVMTVTLPARAF